VKKLAIQKSVLKDLEALPAKPYRQVVTSMLDLLNDSLPHYSRKLTNSDYFRIDVGEYRVIYRADEEQVHVVLFSKRNDNDIYRQLQRLN
jgi:mRNA interferase RelE/StbE